MGIGITAAGKTVGSIDAKRAKALAAQLARVVYERFSPFASLPEFSDDGRSWGIELFPGAEAATFEIKASGAIEFDARTSPIGPGYHHRMCEFIREIEAKHGVKWREVSDETEYYDHRSSEKLRESFVGWMQGMSRAFLKEGDDAPGEDLHVCMGMNEHFTGDQFAVAPFGPLDREFFRRAAASAETALLFMPWLNPEPDGRCFRMAAEQLMWCQVCWRRANPTGGNDETIDALEAQVSLALRRSITLLERAYSMDASGPFPWREWAELYEYDEREAPAHIVSRAGAVRGRLVGYRRNDVRATPFAGLSVTMPGTMIGRYDHTSWFAWDGERSVRVSDMTISPEHRKRSASSSLTALWKDFGVNFDGEPGDREVEWKDRGIAARASLRTVDTEGDQALLLQGIVARVDRLAVCTIVFREQADFEWAERVFRSVTIEAS